MGTAHVVTAEWRAASSDTPEYYPTPLGEASAQSTMNTFLEH
ncbi:hypothetical protein ABTF70_19410 [Acinetobacter baumannii]